VLLATASLSAVAPSAEAAVDPCAHAKALYSAHYYLEAEQEYKRLLGIECATPARALAAREAAKRHAESLQPTKQAEAKDDLAKARRLQDAGFESEARKLTKAVAESSTTPIPARLRAINQRVGWWRDALGVVAPIARTALEVLLVLVGLLVALTGIGALARRFKLSGQLAGFAGASDATLAPVLGAALSAMLARMSDEGATRRVDWQSGTEFKFELPPSLAEAVPQANLLAGLVQMLDKLLYRKLFIVSGTVHPIHQHRGAGVTLVVTNRNGSESEQVTLWEQEFLLKEAGADVTDPVRYERLMLPAAVWLAYRPMIGFDEKKQLPLHTREWRSYALFALAELVPDASKERRLYEQALDRDADNLGARLNLAALLLRRPVAEVPSSAGAAAQPVATGSRESWAECLKKAGVQLDYIARRTSPLTDPIWYRSFYMGAVRSIYLGDSAKVKETLATLTTQMRHNGDKQKLKGLVDALKQPIEVLELTAELLGGQSLEGARARLQRGWLSATAEYNQACFWSRYAGLSKQQAKRVKRTRKAVKALRRAIEREQRLRGEALVDPAFDPIRKDDGFKAAIEPPQEEAVEEKPTRYAVTLDPGPELLSRASAALSRA
jgi:hypothetical protein